MTDPEGPDGRDQAMTLAEQRHFYNERWRGFEFANPLKLARATAILEMVASTQLREPRIVDLGSGSGWLAGILGSFGPTVAVELSDEAVRAAAARYPHVEFVQADILGWDFPRNAFDIVVSQEVLEHMADQPAYLDVAHGLLREGGYLILTTPNESTMAAMEADQRKAWSHQPIESLVTIAELRSLVSKRFQVQSLTTIIPNHGVRGSYRIVNSGRLRRILAGLGLSGAFDRWRLDAGYGLHTVLVARRA